MLTTKHLMPLGILTTIVVLNLSCSKKTNADSEDDFPAPSTTGQHIFACRINGKPWIADSAFIYAIMQGDSLTIRAGKSDEKQEFGFALYNIYDSLNVDYQLTDTSTAYARYLNTKGSSCFLMTPGHGSIAYRKMSNGVVHFTKTTEGIVSGAFSFYVPRDFCDTLFITEGRFDVKYRLTR